MILSDNGALSTALPRSAECWEFGGHLYGLEPLALPVDWRPREAGELSAISVEALLPDASVKELSRLAPSDEGEVERLFWFRWITGHQTTFLTWQVLGSVLDEAKRSGADENEYCCRARALVRAYSLMLLYASSPPQGLYERLIRGPMARQHPNLSGAWARDYSEVRPLIRGKISLGDGVESASLAAECAMNERVHEGIAARVVPSGVSLLLTPDVRQNERSLNRETLLWLYDGIFLTTRQPVSYEVVVRQLIRRLHAILLDITVNGLYPACVPDAGEEPEELLTEDVLELKSDFVATFRNVAEISTMKDFLISSRARSS